MKVSVVGVAEVVIGDDAMGATNAGCGAARGVLLFCKGLALGPDVYLPQAVLTANARHRPPTSAE